MLRDSKVIFQGILIILRGLVEDRIIIVTCIQFIQYFFYWILMCVYNVTQSVQKNEFVVERVNSFPLLPLKCKQPIQARSWKAVWHSDLPLQYHSLTGVSCSPSSKRILLELRLCKGSTLKSSICKTQLHFCPPRKNKFCVTNLLFFFFQIKSKLIKSFSYRSRL